MRAEQIADLIEKLIEEKMRMSTILTSKSLGTNKEFFLQEERKKLAEVKENLVRALHDADEHPAVPPAPPKQRRT